MRKSKLAVLAVVGLATGPLVAQTTDADFWVAGELRQGMTEEQFREYVSENGIEVTQPLPNGTTKSVKLGENFYWLEFCDGKLTYASWIISSNEQYLKSMNQRVNVEGFKLASFNVSGGYSDATNSDMNDMSLRFEHDARNYSVTYHQFAANAQVTYEDSRHDDTYNCVGDGRSAP